jgi:plasmid maintenance system antidote protein VapI
MAEEKLQPIHPGEVLLEEFLKPMGLSQSRLALDIGVHPRRINEQAVEKVMGLAESGGKTILCKKSQSFSI